jgi:HK97 family phage major capsid protein
MATTLELIKELHDRRRGLIEELRETHSVIEASPDGDAEAQKKYDRIDKEVTDLGQRIDNLVGMQEHSKKMDEDRAKFESLVAPPSEEKQAQEDERTRIEQFMRAAVTATYAPSFIDIQLQSASVNREVERHDLTKGVTTAGGFTVPSTFADRFLEHLVEMSGVRQTNATVITTSSGENLTVPATSAYGSAAIVAEAQPIPENDDSFKQVVLGAYKYGKLIEVSRELLEDTAIDLPGFLARSSGRAIGLANGADMVTGNGSSAPEGVTTGAGAVTVGTNGAITADRLIDLYHSVVSGYRGSAEWLMGDATAAVIRKFKDTGTGAYTWQPGLVAGAPDTIFSRPVRTDPFVPTGGVGAKVIGFGDWSQYYIIRDVSGLRFERSDDFRFQHDLVAFRALFRTDAKQALNGATGSVKWLATAA